MSSLLAKINVISKAPADEIPSIFASISESMDRSQLSEKEMRELCSAILQKLPNSPPAVFRSSLSLCEKILDMKSYPATFPKSLLNALKAPLAAPKKPMREAALSLAKQLIDVLTPEAFWDIMFDCFASKSVVLKESALILLSHTLSSDASFRLGKMARPVFALLLDHSPELRQHSLQVVSAVYGRTPDKVEEALKKQFAGQADEIIAKLKGSGDGNNGKKQKETYASIVAQPQLSDAEIEAQLVSEFENPCPDIEPNSGACPFLKLEKTLKRSTDWRERMQGLETLVAHCRGCAKADVFLRGFRGVQDPFVECLTDARSTLSKFACLCLVAMANKLRNSMDQCTDLIIPPLLQRTNHGTAVIAKSSEYAVVKYVQAVCGKRIKQLLIEFAENASVEVRLTVIKSMVVAKDYWPPVMSEEFGDILYVKQRDPSEKVRALVGSIQQNEPISAESIILDDQEEVAEDVIEEDEPARNSFKILIDSRNTNEIIEFIQKSSPKPDITGFVHTVVDLLVLSLNSDETITQGVQLLEVLCENYRTHLYPYLSQIILDLPQDERHGTECLECLVQTFGEFPIAKLLRKSKLEYAHSLMLKASEEHPAAVDFQARTVLNIITNGFYSKFQSRVIPVIKNLFASDPMKCETLFAAIPARNRNDILNQIRDALPQIYQAFAHESDSNIGDQLVTQMENAKHGDPIDFSIIQSIPENDTASLLLGLAAIRECQHFRDEYVPFLMKCTTNRDSSVVGAATLAIQHSCETSPRCCQLLADNFQCNSASLRCFARSLRFADAQDAIASLHKLAPVIAKALVDCTTKYAALDVIAKAVTHISDDLRTIAGKLDIRNEHLLDRMIAAERESTESK